MTLSTRQIADFNHNGFVIVENLLDENDLDPVITEINAHVDRRARQLHDTGQLSNLFKDQPFECGLAALQRDCDLIHTGLDIMEMRGHAAFTFLHNQKLLDGVECLIGSEIFCNPIQHLRGMVPSSVNAPWHQDAGVYWPEGDQSLIVTCWIPLVDVNRAMDVWKSFQAYTIFVT